MGELASTIRKMEKAVIQKSEKSIREGTVAREDWEEDSQRLSEGFKEGAGGWEGGQ
jgi:hypothetical protein